MNQAQRYSVFMGDDDSVTTCLDECFHLVVLLRLSFEKDNEQLVTYTRSYPMAVDAPSIREMCGLPETLLTEIIRVEVRAQCDTKVLRVAVSKS